jgi:hypothetical protein
MDAAAAGEGPPVGLSTLNQVARLGAGCLTSEYGLRSKVSSLLTHPKHSHRKSNIMTDVKMVNTSHSLDLWQVIVTYPNGETAKSDSVTYGKAMELYFDEVQYSQMYVKTPKTVKPVMPKRKRKGRAEKRIPCCVDALRNTITLEETSNLIPVKGCLLFRFDGMLGEITGTYHGTEMYVAWNDGTNRVYSVKYGAII